MKNWQITGFLAILIIGFLLISACTNKGSTNAPPVEVSTPTPQIVYVTVTVLVTPVTTIQTENINSIRTQLNSEWGQIRDVYDTFTINKDKDLAASGGGVNELRGSTIPGTISEYQKIKNDLLNININNPDLNKERTVLVSICDYKIKYLQGTSSIYHASQAELLNLDSSLTEYKNAKLSFRDERDIISAIPYFSKYWEYIDEDDRLAESNILIADQGIARMS